MTTTETIETTGVGVAPEKGNSKRNRYIALLAMLGVGSVGAVLGANALSDGEQASGEAAPAAAAAARPKGLLELCQFLVRDPEINAAISKQTPAVKVSPDACKYKTDPNNQARATWLDPTVQAEVQLAITERLGGQGGGSGGGGPAVGRYKQIAALPGTESTWQSGGTILMYYPEYTISVGFAALGGDGVAQTAQSLAGVVASNR